MRDNYYREMIDRYVFPATVTAVVARVLAVKFHEILAANQKAEQEHYDRIRNEPKAVPLAKIPAADRRKMLDAEVLRKRLNDLDKELRAKYSYYDSTECRLVETNEQINARHDADKAAFEAIQKAHAERKAKFAAVARKMADLHIAAIKAKMPQDLNDELASI